MAAMLLLYSFQKQFEAAWLSRSWRLAIIPGLLLLFHYTFFALQLPPNLAPVLAQRGRVALNDVEGAKRRADLEAFVLRNVKPSSRTMLVFPMGSRIAGRNGLRDHFPFAHPGAIILKQQAYELQDIIATKKIRKVFVAENFEREDFLKVLGNLQFTRKEAFGGVALWTRAASIPPNTDVAGGAPQ
jgi:hypothetical protein